MCALKAPKATPYYEFKKSRRSDDGFRPEL